MFLEPMRAHATKFPREEAEQIARVNSSEDPEWSYHAVPVSETLAVVEVWDEYGNCLGHF